ncbi:MAG TPA: hypothetical protein VGK00_04960 [Anaerolineales bacterium]
MRVISHFEATPTRGFTKRISLIFTILLLQVLSLAATPTPSGGVVLPAVAIARDYSLKEAAATTAVFNVGTRTEDTLPADFPFQILYVAPNSVSNSFTVPAGTMLYVPIVYSTDMDTPYVLRYPDVNDPADVSDYYFGRNRLGADTLRITVDGKDTDLGPGYAAGTNTAGLPDGGHAYTVVAAFLTPLTPGEHTVSVYGHLSGTDSLNNFGGPWEFSISYSVIVQ